MNKGFVNGRCATGKHDVSDPNDIGLDGNTGKHYCRACMRERKRAAREARKLKPQLCRGCKTLMPAGRAWAFCSSKCEHIHRSKHVQQEDIEEARRTMVLLDLHAAMERAATSWERAEIRAKIAAANAR